MSVRPSLLIALVLVASAATPAEMAAALAAPRELALADVNAASPTVPGGKSSGALNVKAQVLLDRANFSPGPIDGRQGENFANALRAFQQQNGLSVSGKLDAATWGRLARGGEPALIEYTISRADVAGPFVEGIPDSYENKAKLNRLRYTGPLEMLAERFHMDDDLLAQLNRDKAFNLPGTVIVVANVNVKPVALSVRIGKLEVDKARNSVRVLAPDGALLAHYPASIGSEEKPAPSGILKVVRVAHWPTYTYNPAFKFRGVSADRTLKMAAGPNNPVGAVWIALNQKTYGIHGTAEPDKVGKVGSHGCVRMTNWDALAVAKLVRKGTPVEFLD